MKSKLFAADQSFLKLPVLWYTVGSFVFTAVIVYLLMLTNSNLELCFSKDCVNYWAESFKVPLAIVALLIPIVGLLNANHKSEQAREALQLSKSQNEFVNYYKHLEEFSKYTKALEEQYIEFKVEPRKLHSILFAHGYSLRPAITAQFEKIFLVILELHNQLRDNNDQLVRKYLHKIHEMNESFIKLFSTSIKIKSYSELVDTSDYHNDDPGYNFDDIFTHVGFEGVEKAFRGTSINHYLYEVIRFHSFINDVCGFETSYSSEFSSKIAFYKNFQYGPGSFFANYPGPDGVWLSKIL